MSTAKGSRHRRALSRAHVARLAQSPEGRRVLLLGAGDGGSAVGLAWRARSVVLVDAAAEALGEASRLARAADAPAPRTVHSPPLDFLVEEHAYDLVVVTDVASSLSGHDRDRLARLCARAVAPGGHVVVRETSRGEKSAVKTEAFAKHLAVVRHEPLRAFLPAHGPAAMLIDTASPLLVRAAPALAALRALPGGRALGEDVRLEDVAVFAPRAEGPLRGPELSVVMIAYNEAECLEHVAREMRTGLEAAKLAFEVVLVDDGSKDGTLAIMRAVAAEDPRFVVVPLSPNRGIGGALRAGFDAARGTYVTWVPADGQIAPEAVLTMWQARQDAPLVNGVYRHRDDPWYRHVISGAFGMLVRTGGGEQVKSGGTILFRRDAWAEHAPRDDDSMVLTAAFRRRLLDADVPEVDVGIDARARVAGSSKVLNPRTIARTVFGVLRMRARAEK